MSPADWTAIAVGVCTITAAFATAVRWLVKHYLFELKNNGGSSLKDRIQILEARVETIITLLTQGQ